MSSCIKSASRWRSTFKSSSRTRRAQSFPPVMRKLRYVQLDQVDALFTQYVAAQLIVTSPLLPARHAAYGRPPIEKRYGLKVLTFAVLDGET